MTDEEKKEAEKKATDKINEIYKKLDDGTSFAEVAKEYSEDTATKNDGGKVGTFTKGEMTEKFNKEFEDAATKLEVGKYTKKTVTSSYGYHIIYKDEQKDKPTLEEYKDTIIEKLAEEALENDSKAEYKAMIELREKYGLTFNDDEVKNQYNNAVNNWLYSKES
jgi:parvulin-like peptidyl-prolyl isomerase